MTDIAIIGAGAAGISAAITAKIRNKSVLLFGNANSGGKLSGGHIINNYPGFYGKTGEEIQKAFLEHLKSLEISVETDKITNIYDMGGYFSLLSGQKSFEAKSVIIATGISFGKAMAGEVEFLGRGVSYCATCDGMLYKGKKVAVLNYEKSEEKEADFLADLAEKVYYLPLYKEDVEISPKCEILKAKPVSIGGAMKVNSLTVNADDGEKTLEVDGVFILRKNIPPSQLISGINLDGNHIAVDLQMRTNIPGIFAAGDIAGTPYQYVKAAGQGNVAALSAVDYLAKLAK